MKEILDFHEWPRWALYTIIASMLSILGTFMVPICAALFKSSSSVNSKLLNYGLSLSAGSMLCTSLLKMLGSTDKSNGKLVFLGFLSGCCISFLLNYIVHSYTSQSLIHCSHSGGDDFGTDEYSHKHTGHGILHSHQDEHDHRNHGSIRNEEFESEPRHQHGDGFGVAGENGQKYSVSSDEAEPLLCYTVKGSASSPSDGRVGECIPIARTATVTSLPLAKCLSESKPPMTCVETNIGYDLENLAVYRDQFMKKIDGSVDVSSAIQSMHNHEDHTHNMETPFSKLLSIGIQTCLVICLHKFPEGFIIFYTNNEDKIGNGKGDIGFSIFLSLAIHNFIEGFSMTLPLFTALKTKWHGLLIAAVLGGGSQPFGAVLGMEWYKYFGSGSADDDLDEKMDFLLSLTAGFLFVISIQMFQTAVAFSDTHHHHEGEDESQIHAQHSAGVTCLKFCCLGVLLILASSALK